MNTEPTDPKDTMVTDPRGFNDEPETSNPVIAAPNTSLTGTEVPSVSPETLSVMPPKNSRSLVHIIIFAIIAIITLGIVASVIWTSAQSKPIAVKSQEMPVGEQHADMAESIVSKITASITDRTARNFQSPQVTQSTPTSLPQVLSPSYRVPGADYYVVIAMAYGLSATDSMDPNDPRVNQSFIQALIDQSTATLISNKFDKTATLFTGTEYQSSDVICFVSAAGSKPFTVSCADKVDYVSSSDAISPFYATYVASTESKGTIQSDKIFSSPTIRNSSISGYKNAVIMISPRQGASGATLLFYQNYTSGWQFFMETQSEPSCNQYQSADIQAAFADYNCMNSDGQEVTVASLLAASQGSPAVPPKQPVR